MVFLFWSVSNTLDAQILGSVKVFWYFALETFTSHIIMAKWREADRDITDRAKLLPCRFWTYTEGEKNLSDLLSEDMVF